MDEKLSVRETEKLVKAINNPKKKKDKVEINRAVYDELEVKIKDAIGNNVKLSPKANGKGKIEIEYYSTDDLERITDILTKMQ